MWKFQQPRVIAISLTLGHIVPFLQGQYILKRGLLSIVWLRFFHNLEETIFNSSHALLFLEGLPGGDKAAVLL